MELIVEKNDGSTFSIEADTVLGVKRKIEMSQGIPVSDQTLYFKGTLLEEDDLDLKHYHQIVKKSRIHLFLPPDLKPNQNNDQVLHHQTEQSPVPSKSSTEIIDIEDSSLMDQMLHPTKKPAVPLTSEEKVYLQDSSGGNLLGDLLQREPSNLVGDLVSGENKPITTAEENVNIQDSCGRDNYYQDLLLRESSSPPSNLTGDLVSGENNPTTAAEENVNIQGAWGRNSYFQDLLQGKSSPPSNLFGAFMYGEDKTMTAEENVSIQGSCGRNSYYQDLLQGKSSPPSNLIGNFMYGEDKPLTAEHFSNIQSFLPERTSEEIISNKNQVLPSNSTEERINTQNETEKSPPVKEIIDITDSPEKVRSAKKPLQMIRVMVLPYSREKKAVNTFPVNVNASENVEELRKELEKIHQQRLSQLNLPEEGYFFIHKQRVLDDDQSFLWNHVAHGDTVDIFPGSTGTRFRNPGR